MAGHWRACVATGALLAAALWLPGSAAAQPSAGGEDARAQARLAFSRGIELAEERRWADAATQFREAMALHDAPAIRYNLASALFEMGEVREASQALAPVRNDPATPPELATHAEALEAQIRERAERDGVDLTAEPDPEPDPLPPLTAEPEPLAPAEDRDGDGASLLTDFRLWAVVGGVVVIAAIVLIAVAASGTEDPVQGNFEPGVLRW